MPAPISVAKIAAKKALKGDEKKVSFPWLMFSTAALFDFLELVFAATIVLSFFNIGLEALITFIIWIWRAKYLPERDFFTTFLTKFIIEGASMGAMPSNMVIVFVAWRAKKKSAEKK